MAARVLIIDNEPEFRSEVQQVIEHNEYQVVTADTRLQAQKVVRSECPDLIILGTIVPRGDAFVFHQWIKRNEQTRYIPLIVIDATLETQLTKGWTKDEGLQLEADEYFCKPVEPAALLAFIDKRLNKAMQRIKVLIADDYALVREGLRVLLDLQKDIEVIGEAVNGRDAIDKTIELSPDIVLMDIVMPGISGLEATREICRKCKDTKVLILTQYDDDEHITASYRAGALGIIPKKSASSQLLTSIRIAVKGDTYQQAKQN